MDAGIAAWDAKYRYKLWRPIDAIRHAAQDGNTTTNPNPTWVPLLITPPFPEYVSGHAAFSGAAAKVLNRLFGQTVVFDVISDGLPNVTRRFSSFDEAAEEAGRSRVYGGIHFEFSNRDGLALGYAVGDMTLQAFLDKY
jgi:PAP2 superfamily